MKRNLWLPIVLSVCATGVLPIVSCSIDNSQNALFHEINDTVGINVSQTIGSGHTFEGEAEADTSKDYRCRFISSTYEIKTGLILPIHKQLQKKDVEVICNNTDIISSCSLSNNILIIPAEQLVGDVTINLLGAEIADWITWDTLQTISDNDIRDEEKHIAKDLFEVGDYKMLRKDSKDINYATIIGFEQKKYTFIDGKQKKSIWAPFNFEIMEPMDKQPWGTPVGEGAQYLVPRWEKETQCTLYAYSNKLVSDQSFGITPRTVDVNTSTTIFSYFFPLSLKDITGKDINPEKELTSGSEPLQSDDDPTQSDKATFSYYRLSEYKCWKLDSISKRVGRSHARWLNTVVDYFERPSTRNETVVFLDPEHQDEYRWEYHGIVESKYISWAFCI